MRSGVKDRKPPYAEPLVRWCERSVNTKVGDKHLRLVFTSYSIAQHGCILTGASPELALTVGRAQPKVRVSAARRNLKEAIGKRLV